MIFRPTHLAGVFLVEPEPANDDRGLFARTWCRETFREHGLATELTQCSVSWNRRRGTLRGMHYQAAPYGEDKLVRCTRGSIFDVALDLRPSSPTYRQWFGAELTAGNRHQVYVPEGLAHGFVSLEDDTEVLYQMSSAYEPTAVRGVRYDDPAFGIAWPIRENLIMSARDRDFPLVAESSP